MFLHQSQVISTGEKSHLFSILSSVESASILCTVSIERYK